MKFKKEIIHDKGAKDSIFYRVLIKMEKLEEEIKALEEKTGIMLYEYKNLQHKKVELAILEEFFEGEECKRYIIED
ncbi:hypothetical protein [Alkaliphilus sp. B6464]|uniref:hypothetical protein n=1 Tax=Alkaliphilus sp. B6464 TaxID=2731219 RepID=UPI001BAD5041|nr:hypothetical protein [Alkaliphilus sp. B6464]QUH21105.1 hypothetical protein HYG84_15260 [Alkaliphilus sp. B6464]